EQRRAEGTPAEAGPAAAGPGRAQQREQPARPAPRRGDAREVADQLVERVVRAREVGAAHPVRELLERQPAFNRGLAKERDDVVALRVGGEHRDLAHAATPPFRALATPMLVPGTEGGLEKWRKCPLSWRFRNTLVTV